MTDQNRPKQPNKRSARKEFNATKEETKMLELMERLLYSSVISDILDDQGVRNHTMNPSIVPLRKDMIVSGRARPILVSEIYEVYEEPYNMMIEAIDTLGKNDLVIVATNNSKRTAVWGELFSTAARARGARGVIIDGFNRDTRKILALKNYPVFSTGRSPHDSKGRAEVSKYNCTIFSGNTEVKPGDLVLADIDGVVVIPRSFEKQVLQRAFNKVAKENTVRKELLKGKLLKEAWEKYRVL